jgi:hypothetical protein
MAFLVTIAFVVFLVLRFRQVEVAVHLYLVAMAAAVSAVLAERALRGLRWDDVPSLVTRLRARRRPWRTDRVRQLEELEHAVDFSLTTAFDVHYRLRPHLVRIASHRLSARRGIHLESDPAGAQRVLDPAAWELVRPDREPPGDRNAAGIDVVTLRAVLQGLEDV